ncbi:hypothetical protein CO168_03015 [Candidatus Shapirobacteria bacterium CG_4_9_14_3_um_filter_36_12]|uniref:Uncharacterized protein n=3 Tax=Candidatus Shapironibacteriota TaxID=1752721 RepID=A0A2M7XMR5_9BACT|nr:MAG: hypothetical protein COS53_02280 [Candidatus Shapirobacteria bacterium CG03_land_8_20_14_0_80_35_14]PIX68223.1 MAG: hypothetical protein COZ41_00820 [Candidatus Shapirobacteria bacterium CG_4_10_14_3_um_filter_35_13]PJA50829.1 MAG: hypothetical protein CO168_03015 [Candidatus Shapirobacteria bacterium CG_4_9_14_3_um_filter_36_12]
MEANYTTKPAITAITYSSPKTLKNIFLFFSSRHNINSPKPPLADSPAMAGPKPIVFFKYNSVIVTDATQFGINPINAVINTLSKTFNSKIDNK